MASTVSDDAASAARWRAAQTGLTILLLRNLRGLRRLINPSRLQATVPTWIEAVTTVVTQHSEVAATLAADFYDGERIAAGVPGSFTVPLADPPPGEQVDNTMRWATKDLWPRDPEAATTTEAQRAPLDVRLDQAEKKAEGAAEKLVLDQGRQTVREAVQKDRYAIAYARAAALGACSFCKLMASRGAVYKNLDAVGRAANEKFTGADSVIKYHDHCHCQPIPVFVGQRFELSPHAAEWDRLYRDYAAGYSGDQLRRFRQALAEHDQHPLPGTL